MYRRGSVNMSELINRFEASDDDSSMSENVKYVQLSRAQGKFYAMHDVEDENSLIKYNEKKSKYFSPNRSTKMTNAFEVTKQTIAMILHRISAFLEMVSKFPFPRMSVMSFGLASLLAIFICPRGFTERALYPGFKIIFSIIYPAYRSFKAVRNKDLKEYLKWIVYWIVYAFFTCFELLTDAIMSWFPFYYEIKVIIFIWLLGPSSRGSMKIYKSCIHPTLISREQEIDDIIQTAQDRGYMHVFRLGSKSVNYANKIIMQETKIPEGNFIVPHQLMKNISLSNISDANEEVDESLRLRKYSYDGNQFNFAYDQARRKPSADFSNEEFNSNYANPRSPTYFRPIGSQAVIEEGKEVLFNYDSRDSSSLNSPKLEKQRKRFDRLNRSDRNELSEDEIMSAYNKLMDQKRSTAVAEVKIRDELPSDLKGEFLLWMESRQKEAKPKAIVESPVKAPKVNDVEDVNDSLNVVKKETDEITTTITEDNTETQDFDEFKDVIDDKVDEQEFLKVPLNIVEDDETRDENVDEENSISSQFSPDNSIVTVIEVEDRSKVDSSTDETNLDQYTIDVKLTLSNSPLEVTTSLSTSSFSLASDKSSDDGSGRKRPATHSKGRAPPPPTIDVIPGHFYDNVTQKYFKETEL